MRLQAFLRYQRLCEPQLLYRVFVGLLAYVNSCGVCPSIQESFWCLVQICEQYLPGYYSPGLVSAIYFLIRKVLEYQVT